MSTASMRIMSAGDGAMTQRLVIFDCDGTLIDSQNSIVASMTAAYAALGLEPPGRADVLSVVGLSLPEAFAVLAGTHPLAVQAELAQHYRTAFPGTRETMLKADPLYPGTRETVAMLAARDNVLLGVATGKSRRGVARLFDREGWHSHFVTIQTADDHPSKPHPSMILQAMAETGVAPEHTVMIGDTSFDMEMARSAGVGAVGVTWGYHTADRLWAAGAHIVVADAAELVTVMDGSFAAYEARA
jgi:phosphoglycolate phosphatase